MSGFECGLTLTPIPTHETPTLTLTLTLTLTPYIHQAEAELQRESRKAELESQLLVQSAANVKKEEARLQAVLANPPPARGARGGVMQHAQEPEQEEEAHALSAVAVPRSLPHEAGRSSPTAAEPNTGAYDLCVKQLSAQSCDRCRDTLAQKLLLSYFSTLSEAQGVE